MKSPKLQVPYAQMNAITQQDTPQTETPKLQHITTTNRPQPLQHQYYRISSTRFHTSAQETVGSGALVSAWVFLGNTIPLPRWQRMELFRQKFRQGKISPLFLTAKFSLRNSPLAKFSLPLYTCGPTTMIRLAQGSIPSSTWHDFNISQRISRSPRPPSERTGEGGWPGEMGGLHRPPPRRNAESLYGGTRRGRHKNAART